MEGWSEAKDLAVFLLGWTSSGCEIQSRNSLSKFTLGGPYEHEANRRETETHPGTLV